MALITEELVIPDVGQLFPKTRRWHDVKPCGTLAAVRRHYRHRTPLCRDCKQAQSRARSDYRKRVRDNGGPFGGRWPEEIPAEGSAQTATGVE